jgi:citrate synthase
MAMVDEIGSADKAEKWVEQALANKQKVMGMGHRVYKAKDPRAILMEEYLAELSRRKGDTTYYDILKTVEKAFRARMEEKGKPIYPNVDFFSGAVYRLLGIPKILFTPIFAISRVAGWLAHILEQRKDNRLYRPKSLYSGPEPREFVALDKRG